MGRPGLSPHSFQDLVVTDRLSQDVPLEDGEVPIYWSTQSANF